MEIKKFQKEVHRNAIAHGWWEQQRPVPEILCLIHSEVSEALEAFRNRDEEHFAEELADIGLRLFDAAEGFGVDLEDEMLRKHQINILRPYKHGGKKF